MLKAVMVAAHKGGVGKTLIACNIALKLSKKGKKVALIDADIASSNVTEFLSVKDFMSLDRETFYPGKVDGLEVFSMGLLVGQKAVSMSGAQYAELLRDSIEYGKWESEYAVVDLPAGSGDEFKQVVSIFGNELLGSIIVVQPAHEVDARRVITLHLDNGIPVIGLIENMSGFKAGAVNYPIFGESIVEKLGKEFNLEVLGKIPLSMKIRKAVNEKNPELIDELGKPLDKAVEKILTLKPTKPGFLSQLKGKARDLLERALVTLALAANKEIDIVGLQKNFGYPGGRIIRLNLMDDKMEKVTVSADFRLFNGKLVAVEEEYNDKEIIDGGGCVIDIKPKAFAMAILGNRKLSDGSIYDLEAAWRMGDARVWGKGDTVRGAYFFKAVWNEIRENKKALEAVKPVLELLV